MMHSGEDEGKDLEIEKKSIKHEENEKKNRYME